jgi:hypothetical protein
MHLKYKKRRNKYIKALTKCFQVNYLHFERCIHTSILDEAIIDTNSLGFFCVETTKRTREFPYS